MRVVHGKCVMVGGGGGGNALSSLLTLLPYTSKYKLVNINVKALICSHVFESNLNR